MRESKQDVIEQYELNITGSRKGRGVMIYETEEGFYALKAVKGSPNRVKAQAMLLEKLRQSASFMVESYVVNKNGEYITKSEDGDAFLLKEYLEGKEWNLEDEAEILRGVQVMGELHSLLQVNGESGFTENVCWYHEVDKHNRELKRVRSFIRARKQKNSFELMFLQLYDTFFKEAEDVWKKIQTFLSENETMERKETLCHGDFTYHNIIHYRNKVAVLNFDKAGIGTQMDDFYQYFRKCMEKNNWSIPLAKKIILHYEKWHKITKQEAYYLYLRFSYPDKFWKVANHYYNGSKNRLLEKGQDKLEAVRRQNDKRREFLRFLEEWSEI